MLGAGNSLQLAGVSVRGNRAGGYFACYGVGGGIFAGSEQPPYRQPTARSPDNDAW